MAKKPPKDDRARTNGKPTKAAQATAGERYRESVLTDFRKIAGPLRGRNQARKPTA